MQKNRYMAENSDKFSLYPVEKLIIANRDDEYRLYVSFNNCLSNQGCKEKKSKTEHQLFHTWCQQGQIEDLAPKQALEW